MKKGFTLVELLAVIVILALLIVITANTVLPMLNKTKEKGMIVYAERVLSLAESNLLVDKDKTYYKISELTGNDSYFGGVRITNSNDGYKYDIKMYTKKDNLYMEANNVSSITNLDNVDFYSLNISSYSVSAIEDICVTKFDDINGNNQTGEQTEAGGSNIGNKD